MIIDAFIFFSAIYDLSYILISHIKALGIYNFIRGFGWAYKRGCLYMGI